MLWLIMAFLSAFFAGITAILAKCGIRHTDSDLATAIRTLVVLAFAWLVVFLVGSQRTLFTISGQSFLFLILSGLATGASWLCYFKALSLGDVNKIVPIDKSSTILTVILAIICFGESDQLALKLICTAILGLGTYLMIEKKAGEAKVDQGPWLIYAILSAVFAALTAILAKVGVSGVESNLATAIRTFVVLIMAWVIVFMKGKQVGLKFIDRKELIFIILSAFATGASWLCYYYAIQNGVVSLVVPIDKLSILVSIAFSYLVFKETLSKRSALGLGLLVGATLVMAAGPFFL